MGHLQSKSPKFPEPSYVVTAEPAADWMPPNDATIPPPPPYSPRTSGQQTSSQQTTLSQPGRRASSSQRSQNLLSVPASGHRRSVSSSPSRRPSDTMFSSSSPYHLLAGSSRASIHLSLPQGTLVLPAASANTNRSAPPRSSPARSAQRQSSGEDPLYLLQKYDTIIIVDDSTSMQGQRWREAREALSGVVDLASSYGIDGINLHFLNDLKTGKNLGTADEVKRLFDSVQPKGYTPTGEKLEELLLDYLLKIEQARELAQSGAQAVTKVKPANFIVLTDGAPSDDPETVIVTAAKRLDAQNFPLTQVGIQFVQIGSDPEATAALRDLDDGIASIHGIRDMVDTTPFSGNQLTAETLTKILIGGINRRVDRRGL